MRKAAPVLDRSILLGGEFPVEGLGHQLERLPRFVEGANRERQLCFLAAILGWNEGDSGKGPGKRLY